MIKVIDLLGFVYVYVEMCLLINILYPKNIKLTDRILLFCLKYNISY